MAIEKPEFKVSKEKKDAKFLMTNGLVECSNGKEHYHDHLISKLESHQMLLAA